MQKKNIYLIIIIIFNIALGYIAYYTINKDVYSDEFVNNKTKSIKSNLSKSILKTKKDILTIQNNLKTSINEDTLNKFFIKYLDERNKIDDILVIQDSDIYIISRDDDSYITAFDSTKSIDIIKWKRIKNNKILSEWDEVFYIDKNMRKLAGKIKNPGVYWNIGTRIKDEISTEFITIATSWKPQNSSTIHLILSFKEEKIINVLTDINKIEDVDLMLETYDNDIFFVPSKKTKQAILLNDSILNNTNTIESRIYNNYKKFTSDNDQISIFSFVFDDNMYWTTVFKPTEDFGLSSFILTIPATSIADFQKKRNLAVYFIITLSLLISLMIIFFLFVKKSSKTKSIIVDEEDITSLLEKEESRFLEFKSSLRWDYRQEKPNPDLEMVIVKTIAAFANSDGGHLIIGLDDDKNILGLENDYKTLKKHDADYFEVYLRNILHKIFGVKYITENIRIKFPVIEEEELCVIEVFKAKEPAYIKTKDKNGNPIEKFYVRSGNSSHELKSLQDINEYIFDRFKK